MEATNEVMTHMATGAVVVYGIEMLKKAGWCPWVSVDSAAVSRILSAGSAVVIALGITITGDASHGWTATIPPAATLMALTWDALKQYVGQQVLYDAVIAKTQPIPVIVQHIVPPSLPGSDLPGVHL